MKLNKEELAILQEIYTEQYVVVNLAVSEANNSTGVIAPMSKPGFVQAITENLILLTDAEGEMVEPSAIFLNRVVSIDTIPADMVGEIQFELANQATVSQGVNTNDTKFN